MSGGLDSTVLCAALGRRGWEIRALTALYGQRNAHEVIRAREQAVLLGCVRHEVIDVPRLPFGGSALTDPESKVPAGRTIEQVTSGRIPSTYVPARNLVLLALATAWAESLCLQDVFIAVNAIDYSGYPDCRPDFVRAFGLAAGLATRDGMRVHAPLVDQTKAGIARLGAGLGVDMGRTISCYQPDEAGRACGVCDSCVLRARGFTEAGIEDPTSYAKERP